jgi:hypothetical protein
VTESVVAAVGGWIIAAMLAITNYLERRGEQRQKVLLQALEYLTGGSQKRSIGIALIEGLWEKRFPYLRSLMPALISQAVYLLLETESREGRHQFHSWLRIMDLIMRAPPVPELSDQYSEVSIALLEHLEAEDPLPRGIQMPRETAQIWFDRFGNRVGTRAGN